MTNYTRTLNYSYEYTLYIQSTPHVYTICVPYMMIKNYKISDNDIIKIQALFPRGCDPNASNNNAPVVSNVTIYQLKTLIQFIKQTNETESVYKQQHDLLQKSICAIDQNNLSKYDLIACMINNNLFNDKKYLFNMMFNNKYNDALFKSIINNKILFDYYEYDQTTHEGTTFLITMIEHKQYSPTNTLISFIYKCIDPALVFDIAIKNKLLYESDLCANYPLSEPNNKLIPKKATCPESCLICTNPVSKKFAFVPCGHSGTCEECFEKMKQKSNYVQCPICRKDVVMHMEIFT